MADFELMRAMGWSFAELEDTPVYVRRFCSDFLAMARRRENRG